MFNRIHRAEVVSMNDYRQKRLFLSPQEVSVLAAFNRDSEASVHEIITRSRLAPSKAIASIASLADKHMLVQCNSFIELTPEGTQTQHRISRSPGSIFTR